VNTIRHFIAIYRLYRAGNPRRHAFVSAYRIAVQRLPF
jgi:hypothetical protein